MINTSEPCMTELPKIGNQELGYISVTENEFLPFPVKRLYWTYSTPEEVTSGRHAHNQLQQILVAVAGKIIVDNTLQEGAKYICFI